MPTRDEIGALRLENHTLRARLHALEMRLAEVELLAESDTLTPLPNRRAFEREFVLMAHRAIRFGIPAFVLFVDMDGLKIINDTHGHSAGDSALRHVAQVLRASVRPSDFVARIGGDEFGILLDNFDEEGALAMLDILFDAVAGAPLTVKAQEVPVAISIGCTRVRPEDNLETALSRADRQMYSLKAAQRADRS